MSARSVSGFKNIFTSSIIYSQNVFTHFFFLSCHKDSVPTLCHTYLSISYHILPSYSDQSLEAWAAAGDEPWPTGRTRCTDMHRVFFACLFRTKWIQRMRAMQEQPISAVLQRNWLEPCPQHWLSGCENVRETVCIKTGRSTVTKSCNHYYYYYCRHCLHMFANMFAYFLHMFAWALPKAFPKALPKCLKSLRVSGVSGLTKLFLVCELFA